MVEKKCRYFCDYCSEDFPDKEKAETHEKECLFGEKKGDSK